MISDFPACICMDFVSLLIGSLGSCGEWVHCKHVIHHAKCDIPWADGIFHSSSNLELKQSL